MVDLKHILRQAFGKSSLQNEDWLEPSDDMLERIEAKIYPSKNKRSWLLPALLLLLFLIIGGLVWGIQEINAVDSWTQNQNIVTQNIGQIPAEITENISPADKNTSDIITNSSEKRMEENKGKKISVASGKKQNQNPGLLTENNGIKAFGNSVKQISKPANPDQNRVDRNYPADRSIVAISQNTSSAFPVRAENDLSRTVEKRNLPSGEKDFLINASTPLSTLKNPAVTRVEATSGSPVGLPADIVVRKNKAWSIVAGAGVSFWQFQLNDAYRKALAPADFQATNGTGVRTFVGIDKKINSRFRVGMAASYERITFHSGHNSTLTYNRTAETNNRPSNNKVVTMATPLGFVESDLVINRENDVSESEVLIDIKNRHRIQSLDVQLTLDYEVREIIGLRPVFSVGAGVQRLVKLTNALESFTPRQKDFSAGKGVLTSEPSSLQRWSPTVSAGLSLEKDFFNNLSVGINGGYLLNLNELQKMDGFSTGVYRLNGGIYLRRRF